MSLRFTIMIIGLWLGLTVHPGVQAQQADGSSAVERYQEALHNTQSALVEAEKKVQIWTSSETLLKRAQVLAENGDYEQAIQLADEARLHAELAMATAEREKQIWRESVPK